MREIAQLRTVNRPQDEATGAHAAGRGGENNHPRPSVSMGIPPWVDQGWVACGDCGDEDYDLIESDRPNGEAVDGDVITVLHDPVASSAGGGHSLIMCFPLFVLLCTKIRIAATCNFNGGFTGEGGM